MGAAPSKSAVRNEVNHQGYDDDDCQNAPSVYRGQVVKQNAFDAQAQADKKEQDHQDKNEKSDK